MDSTAPPGGVILALRHHSQRQIIPIAARVVTLEVIGEVWLGHLKSPPVEGKANQELIGLAAEAFGRRKGQIVIKAGASGRRKLVQIT